MKVLVIISVILIVSVIWVMIDNRRIRARFEEQDRIEAKYNQKWHYE